MKIIEVTKEFFCQYRSTLLILILITLPIKLSWTYIVLIPTLLIWLTLFQSEAQETYRACKPLSSIFSLFLIVALLTSLFGVSPHESIIDLLKLSFVSCAGLFTAHYASQYSSRKVIITLCAAQGLAALYTFGEFFGGDFLGRLFHGAVTESGQLALILPLSFLLLIDSKEHESLSTKERLLFGLVTLLLMGALLLNLKRGPIAGVVIASSILFLWSSWRVFATFIATALIAIFSFAPLRERILYSSDHFMISGGRGEIWKIAGELALRYPLGIGYQNSHILKQFSHEVPKELEHFHSNILNILVETGWIGLALYLALFVLFFSLVFKTAQKAALTQIALLSSILSWQIAGLVEYNFGDSEVFIPAIIIMGLALSPYVKSDAH